MIPSYLPGQTLRNRIVGQNRRHSVKLSPIKTCNLACHSFLSTDQENACHEAFILAAQELTDRQKQKGPANGKPFQ
jgi:hypothetical protein